MKRKFRWTKEPYLEKAGKCRNLEELEKKVPSCYLAAKKYNWSVEFCNE